jgi:hypothetical protein
MHAAAGDAAVMKPECETFIHEAGHAVARILMAPEQGWAPSKAVMNIAIGSGASAHAQGTVFGPLVSKYMHDFIDAKYPGDIMLSPEEIASLYPEMRAVGVDLEKNFRAKNVESIFGLMAEARCRGQSFDEAWRDPTNADDVSAVHDHARWMGITDPVTIEDCVQVAKRRAADLIARIEVWRAIEVLAKKLKLVGGSMKGERAARLICKELAKSDRTST